MIHEEALEEMEKSYCKLRIIGERAELAVAELEAAVWGGPNKSFIY